MDLGNIFWAEGVAVPPDPNVEPLLQSTPISCLDLGLTKTQNICKTIPMRMLNSATLKTPSLVEDFFSHICYTSRVMANLVLKFRHFRYHGNKGWSFFKFR